jgi:hypothetical protein
MTYSSAESHSAVGAKTVLFLTVVCCVRNRLISLLYILPKVPNVLLENPGNNETVGGDRWTAMRDTTIFNKET